MSDPQARQLYATDSTRTQLGWLGARITEVADADVLVIAREDIIAFKTPVSAADIRNQTEAFVKGIDYEVTAQNLQNLLVDSGVPDEFIRQFNNPAVLTAALTNILEMTTSAKGFDLDGDGENDFGIILAPDFQATNTDWIAHLSNQPFERIENVPGGNLEGLALVMYHEAGHIKDNHDNRHVLFKEMYADARAREFYTQDIEAGRLNASFLPVFELARAGGSLGAPGGYMDAAFHQLNGQFVEAHLSLLPSHSTHVSFEDTSLPMADITTASNAELKGMLVVNDILQGVMGLMKMREMIGENQGGTEVSGDATQWFKTPSDIVFAMADGAMSQQIGTFYAQADPAAAYGTLKAMEAAGIFSDNVFQGERDYIDALDRFFDAHADDTATSQSYKDAYEETRRFLEEFNVGSEMFKTAESPTGATPVSNLSLIPD